jgi:hypothetical protein
MISLHFHNKPQPPQHYKTQNTKTNPQDLRENNLSKALLRAKTANSNKSIHLLWVHRNHHPIRKLPR